ncbi:MAG: molybdate ABC transporter substrate-binding protein [Acidobacteria bacterium]|nr:molybdate ABC transporter substrate-binding protein [Acidobacteriota bacterium]
MLARFFLFGYLTLLTFCSAAPLPKNEVRVAAASDLTFALEKIAKRFEQLTGNRAKVSFGSSGNLYAQIRDGAPFDVFFSADLEYARRLQEEQLALAGSLYVYARGRLAVWTRAESGLDVESLGIKALQSSSMRKIAIANPRHAPYGRAAIETLRHYGVYENVLPRLIYGESISQAAQFAQSGAADAGIIALSLAVSPEMKASGIHWEVPEEAHTPLNQAVVLLRHDKRATAPAARRFFEWVSGEYSRSVLRSSGFVVDGLTNEVQK